MENPENKSDNRAAILSPNRITNLPGYYLVMGRTQDETPDGRMPELIFLTEGEDHDFDALVKKFLADEDKYRFNTVYFEPYSNFPTEFVYRLNRVLRGQIPWARGMRAIYAEDIRQGVMLLDQWTGQAGTPKETRIADQFSNIRPDTFDDPAFYTFTALRYVLAGYLIDRHNFNDIVAHRREEATKKEEKSLLDAVSQAAAREIDWVNEQVKIEYEGWNG